MKKHTGATTLRDRLACLKRIDGGECQKSLAEEFGVSPGCISKWKQNRHKMEKWGDADESAARKTLRDFSASDSLHQALFEWMQVQRGKGIPITENLLIHKAQSLHTQLKLPSPPPKFSNGWVHNFKTRFGIRQIQITGETLSADTNAAEEYRGKLKKLMQEEGLSEEQVYNADETGLYYKCLPSRSLAVAKENRAPGFKDCKERLTILACVNASGTHRLPLLVIGKYANPRPFSKVNRKTLPALYTHSAKAWMNSKLFEEWFHNNFVPDVTRHLVSKGLPPKAILIVDNASAHLKVGKTGDIRLEFLPPNVTSIIQPLDQGAIALMKRRYRQNLLTWLADASDLSDELKAVNVLVALKIIADSWAAIKSETLANCWHNIGLNRDSHYSESEPKDSLKADLVAAETDISRILSSEKFVGSSAADVAEWLNCDADNAGFESSEEAEEGYVVLNLDRKTDQDPGIAISHEEGAAVIDRALLYLQQIGVEKSDPKLISVLRDQRDKALKKVQVSFT